MSARVRILIVTNGALCRNPRVLKEATALGRARHDVTVLTIRNQAAAEQYDVDLLRTAPFQRVVVDVMPTPTHAAFRHRAVFKLARYAVRTFGWQTPEALGPYAALLQAARERPADLTIVHNEVAHCVGAQLLAEGRRVSADIEDWHSEDLLPADRRGRPLRLLRRVERTLLHRAAYTTTTSQALATALHHRYGGHQPTVISNSFPLPPRPERRGPGSTPAFFWFSQTLGPGRGLETFVAAWARTSRPSRLVLLGEGRPEYRAELLALVPSERQAAVEFLPWVAPAELPAVIARHDIGLALEDPAIVNRDLTITNKVLQYLGAGLAVVATATAGQREVLAHDASTGVIVQDPSNTPVVTALLDALLADPVGLLLRQQAARGLAEDIYCWEREEPRLLAQVSAALTKRAKFTS